MGTNNPIYSCFVMRGTLLCLFLMISMLMLLMRLTLLPEIWTIYPSKLQLNKTNTSDTEAAFLDLHLLISNDTVSTKIYDKHDDFDFEIVNFPFLDDDDLCSLSYIWSLYLSTHSFC